MHSSVVRVSPFHSIPKLGMISSAVRAPRSHRGGRWFKSSIIHKFWSGAKASGSNPDAPIMDLLETIKSRRSIRAFQEKEIPTEVIEQFKEALIWAPSAGNLQSRKFYFVFNQQIKKQLAEVALNQNFIAQAPLVVVACADARIKTRYGQRGQEVYMICDVAASIQNLLLLVHQLGLGAVWIGAFDEVRLAQLLNCPDYLRPIAIIPVGLPAEKPSPPPRVSKEEAVELVK